MVSESSFLIDSIYKGASESVRLQVIALWDRQADSMRLAIKASSPDNQVCFSRFEYSTDVIQDNASFKGLGDMFYFYHFLCQH